MTSICIHDMRDAYFILWFNSTISLHQMQFDEYLYLTLAPSEIWLLWPSISLLDSYLTRLNCERR